MAVSTRYDAIGSVSFHVHRCRPFVADLGLPPCSRPLDTAGAPLGASSTTVHVALSDGWSLTGTQVAVPLGSDMENQPPSSSTCQPTGMPHPGNSVCDGVPS